MTAKTLKSLAPAALAACLAGPAFAQVSLSSTTRSMLCDLRELGQVQADDAVEARLKRFFDGLHRAAATAIESGYPQAARQVVVPQNVYLTPGQLRAMDARGQIQMSESRVATRANLHPRQDRALRYVLKHPAAPRRSVGLLDLIGCWLSGL